MKLIKSNWYGFDHKEVAKKLEGDLTFVNSFCVLGEYKPVTVYKAANPNREKGHKDYVFLNAEHDSFGGNGIFVRGRDKEDVGEDRYQTGIHCLKCDEVNFSVMRHDYKHCSCENTMIDGGKDYTRSGGKCMEDKSYQHVKIDLFTSEMTPIKEKIKKVEEKQDI